MYNKVTVVILFSMLLMIGSTLADGDDGFRRGRQGPIRQILRPLLGRPIFQGRQPFLGGGGAPIQGGGVPIQGGGVPIQGGGFGNANAAGLGNGFVQNNQAVGTGTGIANAGPGGFGIGLGIGAAVATPLGNFAVGDGQSISVGKK